MAEAYWDLEWALQQQGFDYCYDKRLYDRLVARRRRGGARAPHADVAYQQRLVRFIENHDEPRAAATFPPRAGAGRRRDDAEPDRARGSSTRASSRAGRVHAAGLPRPPAGRAGRPRPAGVLRAAAARALADDVFRDGEWQLGERSGWDGNDTWENLVAWGWRGESRKLVVVNLSGGPRQATSRCPGTSCAGGHGSSTTQPAASATSAAATTSATASMSPSSHGRGTSST